MFTSLYENFRNPLLRFVRYKTNDLHFAEDIVQEVFIKAYQSFDTLKEKEKFQSWLFAIAANTIKDHYRKRRIDLTEETDRAEEEEISQSILQELDCCLLNFMQTLSPTQNEVLQAIYFDELTLNEYARKNNLNLSTLKSHAKRAKTALKTTLMECCHFESNSRNEVVDFYKRGERCK
ncbi:MAG: sigma-70 family RNA polymerase sigma factor [Sulfurimonadaceae bacterium]|jgi:RNA polymerase sigma-70 factor (ECF subfamily)